MPTDRGAAMYGGGHIGERGVRLSPWLGEHVRDRGPLQLPPQLQVGLCRKQSQPSILDRAIKIHPNTWYCSKLRGSHSARKDAVCNREHLIVRHNAGRVVLRAAELLD
jgi:hypothetical protein